MTKPFKVETRSLPCRLTVDELLARGHDLSQVHQDIVMEEKRHEDIKQQLKARMAELVNRQTRLSMVVHQREEWRDVEVHIVFTEGGMVQEVRTDTGECLLTRPPRNEERQFGLGMD